MVEQYDNKNNGACFKPYNQNDRLILSGKIDIDGIEHRIVCINEETKNGTKVVQVYTKLCTLWNNEKTNDNQPDKGGPLEEKFNKDTPLKISAWRRKDKNGNDYLSLSISEKMQKRTEFDGAYQHMEEKKTPIDDDIPF
tara:strand:- start:7 stop:423 length:417 start_codon:yes stop_codon:yes gene_type:complete